MGGSSSWSLAFHAALLSTELSSLFVMLALTKMKRLLQFCSSVAATLQQLDIYATTGGDKVAK